MLFHSLTVFIEEKHMWKNKHFKSCMIFIPGCYLLIRALTLDTHCGNGTKDTPQASRKRSSLFPRMHFCSILPPHSRKQTYTKVRKIFLLACNDGSSGLAAHMGFEVKEKTLGNILTMGLNWSFISKLSSSTSYDSALIFSPYCVPSPLPGTFGTLAYSS